MTVKEAIVQYLAFHEANSKPHTVKSYRYLLRDVEMAFGGKELAEISPADIFGFLSSKTEGLKEGTKNHTFIMIKFSSITA